MKALKIGRSSTNDIVISDATVSSQHAIISILDTKEVKIKDLNSMNGTYVNGRRITTETTISASDVIKVGNSTLDWVKYLNEKKPNPPVIIIDESVVKTRKTIGRDKGDIVLNHSDVSSNHAQLIKKVNGDILIADSGSVNGTYVNGQKISIQILRPGDRVLIANKYPLDWQSVFKEDVLPPSIPKPKKLKTILMSVAAVIAIAAIVAGVVFFLGKKPLPPEKIYSYYEKSIVLIRGQFYYEVSAKNKILGRYGVDKKGNLCDLDEDESGYIAYTGTGFFISKDGKIITNRHVVAPGMGEENTMELIKTTWQKRIAKLSLTNQSAYLELQPLIGDVKVEGKLVNIAICLNGNRISGLNELIPCSVLKDSGKEDIDVGLIQVNSQTLPAGVEHIVDLSAIDNDITLGKKVYTIGFPAGFTLAFTDAGVKATSRSGEIAQMQGDITFGLDNKVIGGASGSPVFNEHGQLTGIINATKLQDYTMAVKAKYAAELAK